MRHIKYLLILSLLLISSTLSAKDNKQQTVYMFGLSASFNDSIVYITEIQEVRAYVEDDRTHFLVNRDDYSYQLKNFFENRGQLYRTCITVYADNQRDIQKKYDKMVSKYTTKTKGKFDVIYLKADEFRYRTVAPDEGSVIIDSEEAERNAQADKDKKQESLLTPPETENKSEEQATEE